MKLHTTADYAVQILQYFNKHKGVVHTAASMAESTEIAYPFVIKILNQLEEKGLLKSIKGNQGSYELCKHVDDISVYDVLSCIECQFQTHPTMRSTIHDIQEKVIQDMSDMSIAELASDCMVERLYSVETEDKKTHTIPFDEIIMIQSSPKQGMLELHLKHGLLEFRGMISRIATNIPEFFRSHISVVVNINHIKNIDAAKREIELTNGRFVPIAPIAQRKVMVLLRCLSATWRTSAD